MPDGARLPFEVDGKPYSVPVASSMEANDAAPLIGFALRGLGVIYVPKFMIESHVDSGALVQVLRSHMPRVQCATLNLGKRAPRNGYALPKLRGPPTQGLGDLTSPCKTSS